MVAVVSIGTAVLGRGDIGPIVLSPLDRRVATAVAEAVAGCARREASRASGARA